MTPKIWAHRGASGDAPENTLEAFRLAVEMGADGVELDVHMTKDGQLAVIHDERVDRTSDGTGLVAEHTLEQLQTLDFSCGMEAYRGAKMPVLAQVYELLKPTALTVNVEVKCDVIIYDGIWDKLAALEREMGMQGRVIYSSFNHYVLLKMRECLPDCPIGLLYSCGLVDPWLYAKHLGANALHPHYLALRAPGLAEGCKEAGIALHPWTVNTREGVLGCAKAGCQAVITNYPAMARETLGQ